MPRGRRSLWDRLWTKVDTTGGLDACWLWAGGTRRTRDTRRPKIGAGGKYGKTLNATRVVCRWMHGRPPSRRHEAGHTCPSGEHPLCLNPTHLRWVTRSENEAQKDRSPGTDAQTPPARHGVRWR